jgi:hypothetical protein
MATAKKQPGRDTWTTLFIELVGVGLITILAGMNDDMGKIMLIVMWGFVLGWLLINSQTIAAKAKSL